MALQGMTFRPLVQPSAAPQLTFAQMDSNLATISVGFNQATNEVSSPMDTVESLYMHDL